MRELRKEREALVATLKKAVRLTLATMVLAVVVLALAPVVGSRWLSMLGAIAFAVCINSYRPILNALWQGGAQQLRE